MSYADELLRELLGEEEKPEKPAVKEEPAKPPPNPKEKKGKKPEKKVFVSIQAGWKILQPYDTRDHRSSEELGCEVKKVPAKRRIHCGFCKRLLEAGEQALFNDAKLEKTQYWWCYPTCSRVGKNIVSTCN